VQIKCEKNLLPQLLAGVFAKTFFHRNFKQISKSARMEAFEATSKSSLTSFPELHLDHQVL
jgi:hypothetical protein